MIFAFGDCEIDVERRELRREGRTAHIEPQVFDLLLHLVRNRDRVMGKDELFGSVWQGRFVSESTLNSRISMARRAIGDDGERQVWLRTIARRGFRFLGKVEERVRSVTVQEPHSPDGPTCDLPGYSTGFFGREADLAAISSMLATARLVTLTGAGGVGKTRLAVHTASRVESNYRDGVRMVELASLSDAGATGHAIAGVLGVTQQPGRTIEQSLVNALRIRHLLLVLDNCEHLIDAIGKLAREILARCAHVTLLATSREVLAVDGEQVWPVGPLVFKDADSPAVRLFAERARAVSPHFELGADVEAVVDICGQLDGMPLAIELAAARVRSLSAGEIRSRLGERFRLLTTGARAGPERHQTLRRAIQWSFDLLSPRERRVLSRLAVFAGGFTLAGAERVCAGGEIESAEILDLLDSLVRKSLLRVERCGSGLRYTLLETIRQFCEEQLADIGESEELGIRHTRYFCEDSDFYFNTWLSPQQPLAYEFLDCEIANLRKAFRRAHGLGDIASAGRIASNVGDMARFRMREEAANWAAEIVAEARRTRHPRLAVLLTWAASSAWSQGRLEEAKSFGEEAISLSSDEAIDPFVWAFTDLAMVASYKGEFDRATEFARRGAQHLADRQDRFCLALYPYFLAVNGRAEEAMQTAGSVVAEVEATGIPGIIGIALYAKGKAFAAGRPAEALIAYEAALAISNRSGNRLWEIMIALEIASLQAHSGAPVIALRAFRDKLDQWRQSTDLIFVSHGLGSLVVLFERLGHLVEAATLQGVTAGVFESNPFVPDIPVTVARLRAALGEATYGEAIRRGVGLSLNEAHDFAAQTVERSLAALALNGNVEPVEPEKWWARQDSNL